MGSIHIWDIPNLKSASFPQLWDREKFNCIFLSIIHLSFCCRWVQIVECYLIKSQIGIYLFSISRSNIRELKRKRLIQDLICFLRLVYLDGEIFHFSRVDCSQILIIWISQMNLFNRLWLRKNTDIVNIQVKLMNIQLGQIRSILQLLQGRQGLDGEQKDWKKHDKQSHQQAKFAAIRINRAQWALKWFPFHFLPPKLFQWSRNHYTKRNAPFILS